MKAQSGLHANRLTKLVNSVSSKNILWFIFLIKHPQTSHCRQSAYPFRRSVAQIPWHLGLLLFWLWICGKIAVGSWVFCFYRFELSHLHTLHEQLFVSLKCLNLLKFIIGPNWPHDCSPIEWSRNQKCRVIGPTQIHDIA